MALQLIWLNSFPNKPRVLSFSKSSIHYKRYFLVSMNKLHREQRVHAQWQIQQRTEQSRDAQTQFTDFLCHLPCLIPALLSHSCPMPSSPSKNLSSPSGKQSLNYNPSFNPILQLRAPQGWIQQGCVLFWRTSGSFFFQLIWNTLVLWRRELYSTSPPQNKRGEERASQTVIQRKRGDAHWESWKCTADQLQRHKSGKLTGLKAWLHLNIYGSPSIFCTVFLPLHYTTQSGTLHFSLSIYSKQF